MTDVLDSIFATSPTREIRQEMVIDLYKKMAAIDPSIDVLSPLAGYPNNFTWVIPLGTRKVHVEIPKHGEDGAFIVSITGRPMDLIERGIDRYSRQFMFHRISENDETLKFTIEWRGDQHENDVHSLLFFLKTLTMMPHF